MNGQQMRISVIDPVNPAIDRAKRMLFDPFDLGRWFTIGFCAWLAMLGTMKGGGGPGGGGNFGGGHDVNFHEAMEQFKQFVMANLYWIVPLAIFLVVLVVGLTLLMLWLSSRGRFMFVHCVAQNKAEVAAPWHMYAGHARSLFLFRLVLGLIGLVVLSVWGGTMAWGAWTAYSSGAIGLMIILIVVGVLVHIPLTLTFAAIARLTKDMVVPIMYLHTDKCTMGWRILMTLLKPHFGAFVLYLLFQIVISMAVGIIIFMICCVTCCIACCLLAIPFIGTVAKLPILVFEQSYKLYFLQQFGSDFDVFPPVDPSEMPVESHPQGLVVPPDVSQDIPGI